MQACFPAVSERDNGRNCFVGKGFLPPIKESVWELDVGICTTLWMYLIMADFIVCKFYLSEPYFFSKAEEGGGITF